MRVLLLIDHLEAGGAQTAVRRIAQRLVDKGVDVRVCVSRKNNVTVKLPCPFYALAGGKYSLLRAGLSLRRLCREQKIDLIHAHLSHAVGTALLFSKVPVIAHEHGMIIGKGFYCWLHRRMYSMLHPNRIIACSNVLKKRLWSLNNCPITTIGNPINYDEFASLSNSKLGARRIFGCDDNLFIVGYLGRLTNNKNLESFIDCAELLASKGFGFIDSRKPCFLIIGDGNYRNHLEKLVRRRGMKDIFYFYGQSEKPTRLVQAFDCALQVAERGSFGQAVLELMAARIPVVVPPVGAFSEVVEDRVNGFIAENASGAALASAVLTVANNYMKGIKDRAQETARRFDGRIQIDQIISIYDKVLNERLFSMAKDDNRDIVPRLQ